METPIFDGKNMEKPWFPDVLLNQSNDLPSGKLT